MVTVEQLELMRNMLGLLREKKPYRNYAYYYEEKELYEDLIKKGLAVKEITKKGHHIYSLTYEGIEMAYGKKVSKKIFSEIAL